MEKINQCPVCGSSKFESHLVTKDFLLTNEEFSISRCVSCTLLFTNPRPLMAEAGKYYQSEEYISHSTINKGVIDTLYSIVRKYAINKKVNRIRKVKESGKLLDIGAGTGDFMKEASKNYSVIGIEPDEDARKHCQNKKGLKVYNEEYLKEIEPSTVDVVTMWHVLEHVYNLDDRLQQIRHILKKDGLLVIAVPNPESPDAIFYKEFWAAYDVPRHVYHFTKRSIQLLLSKNGFELEKESPMVFDAYYISLLSEKYKNGRPGIYSAVLHGFQFNLKAKSDGINHSSITYMFTPKNA